MRQIIEKKLKVVKNRFDKLISAFKGYHIKKQKLHSIKEILFLLLYSIINGCVEFLEINSLKKDIIIFLSQLYHYTNKSQSSNITLLETKGSELDNFFRKTTLNIEYIIRTSSTIPTIKKDGNNG